MADVRIIPNASGRYDALVQTPEGRLRYLGTFDTPEEARDYVDALRRFWDLLEQTRGA